MGKGKGFSGFLICHRRLRFLDMPYERTKKWSSRHSVRISMTKTTELPEWVSIGILPFLFMQLGFPRSIFEILKPTVIKY